MHGWVHGWLAPCRAGWRLAEGVARHQDEAAPEVVDIEGPARSARGSLLKGPRGGQKAKLRLGPAKPVAKQSLSTPPTRRLSPPSGTSKAYLNKLVASKSLKIIWILIKSCVLEWFWAARPKPQKTT